MVAAPPDTSADPPASYDAPPPPYAALPPYMAGPGHQPAAAATYHHGPSPGLGYAGFWVRALAALLDLGAIVVIASLTHVRGVNASCGTPGGAFCDYPSHLVGLAVVVGVLGAYWVTAWSTLGGSAAQRLFGMRVVKAADGRRISPRRAAGRYLATLLSCLPFAAGLLWTGLDAQRQGWHDRAAGTFVVRKAARKIRSQRGA